MNTLSETITDKIAIEQVTARGQGSYQFVSGATDISPPAERSEDVSNDDQVELPRHRIGRQIPSRERDIAARNVSVDPKQSLVAGNRGGEKCPFAVTRSRRRPHQWQLRNYKQARSLASGAAS